MNFLQRTITFASVLAATALYGCVDNKPTTNPVPSHTIQSPYEQKLRNANEIVVDEVIFCLGKEYEVYVNDEKVATVEGKNINWWEDRFILKTIDGKILETENEEKRILSFNRSAGFYDGDGKITGYIAENRWTDLFNWNHVFHTYDANEKEIGKTENLLFAILDEIELYDKNGNIDYKTKEKFSVFDDVYTITVIDKKSGISVGKAIMLTCIEDALKDAKEAEEAKEDNNKSESSEDD